MAEDLSRDEAVAAVMRLLEEAAKIWPRGVQLFAGDSSSVYLVDTTAARGTNGELFESAVLAEIDIPNDGGHPGVIDDEQ